MPQTLAGEPCSSGLPRAVRDDPGPRARIPSSPVLPVGAPWAMLVFRARGGQIYRRGVGGSARCERIWRCYSISHGEGGLRKKRVFPALSNEATEVPGGLYRSGVILRGGRAGRALLPLPRRTASFPEPMPRPSACFFFAMNFTFFLPPLTPEVVLQSQPKSAHANCFLWFVCGWVFFFFFLFPSVRPTVIHLSTCPS